MKVAWPESTCTPKAGMVSEWIPKACRRIIGLSGLTNGRFPSVLWTLRTLNKWSFIPIPAKGVKKDAEY